MQPASLVVPAPAEPDERMDRLSGSARGWHTVQMAVLGFIGICGILHAPDSSVPGWAQVGASLLAVAALGLACLAVFMVGRVAYPISIGTGEAAVTRARALLRGGIRLTVVALILIVIAALSGWWPKTSDTTATVGMGGIASVSR
jgi:hypothetical protein